MRYGGTQRSMALHSRLKPFNDGSFFLVSRRLKSSSASKYIGYSMFKMDMINKNYNSLDHEDFIERDLQIAKLWKKLPFDEKIKWNQTAESYELKNNQKGVSKSELRLYHIFSKNYLMNNLTELINELRNERSEGYNVTEDQISLLLLIQEQHELSKTPNESIRFIVKCLDEADVMENSLEKAEFIQKVFSKTAYSSETEIKQAWDTLLHTIDMVLQEKFKDLTKLEKFSLSFANRHIINLLPLIPIAPRFIKDYDDVIPYSRVGLSLFEIFYFENLQTINNPLTYFQNLMKFSRPVLQKWENLKAPELQIYKAKFMNQKFGTLVSIPLFKVLKTSAYVLNLRNKFYYLLLKEKAVNFQEIEETHNSELDIESFDKSSSEEININKIDSPTLFQDINNEWEVMMQDNTLRANSDLINKKINDFNKNKEIKLFSETMLLMHKYDRIAKLENLSAFHYFVELNYPHFKDILFLLNKSRKDEFRKSKSISYTGSVKDEYLRDSEFFKQQQPSFSSSFYDFYDFQLSNLRKMIALRKMIKQWDEMSASEKAKYVLLKDIIKSQINFHKTTSFESKEKRVFFDTLISQKIIEKSDPNLPWSFKDQKRIPLDYDIIKFFDYRRKLLLSIFDKIDDVIDFKENVFLKYEEEAWRKISAKPYTPVDYITNLLAYKPSIEETNSFPKFKDFFHKRFPEIYQQEFESSSLRSMNDFENLFAKIETGIPLLTKMLDKIYDEHVDLFERELTKNYLNADLYKSWETTLDFAQGLGQISLPIVYRSTYNYYRHVIQGLENSIFKYDNYCQQVLPSEFEKNMKESVRKVSQIDVAPSEKSSKLFRELVHWSNVRKLKETNGKVLYVSNPTPKLFYLKSNNPNHQIIKVMKKFPNENVNKIINRVLHNAYMYYYRHGQSSSWAQYREEAEKCETDTHELDFSCYMEMQELIQQRKFEKLKLALKTNPDASILDCELLASDLDQIVDTIKLKYDEILISKNKKKLAESTTS